MLGATSTEAVVSKTAYRGGSAAWQIHLWWNPEAVGGHSRVGGSRRQELGPVRGPQGASARFHPTHTPTPVTWVLERDVNLGANDIMSFLQAVGSHRGPLAAGVNEKHILVAHPFHIFSCGRKEGRSEGHGEFGVSSQTTSAFCRLR